MGLFIVFLIKRRTYTLFRTQRYKILVEKSIKTMFVTQNAPSQFCAKKDKNFDKMAGQNVFFDKIFFTQNKMT